MREGEDTKLPNEQHTRRNVYAEMLAQVVREYSGIGDFRTLTSDEIRFFYDWLRPELKVVTKPK